MPGSGRQLDGQGGDGAHLRPGFYNAINRVYARYFSVNPPARSFVPVASWQTEFDIQIERVAVG
nr:hypothetical protein [Mesorhizobium sp. B3-1-9]